VSAVVTLLLAVEDASGTKQALASKHFRTDGSKYSPRTAYYLALQLHARSVSELGKIWNISASQSSTLLCNAAWPNLPVFDIDELGEIKFAVFQKRGFQIAPQSALSNIKTERIAVARTKENTQPTSWLLIDVDETPATPDPFRDMNRDRLFNLLDRHCPGISRAPRIDTSSASSRVFRDGAPVGKGRGHSWVQLKSGEHLAQFRSGLRSAMVASGDFWTEPDVRGRSQIKTPIDFAPMNQITLVFSGKPTSEEGLVVGEPDIELVNHDGAPWDLNKLILPGDEAVREAHQKARPGVRVSVANSQIAFHDLLPDMPVELEKGKVGTLDTCFQELLLRRALGDEPKLRIQSPLRPESRSLAAFVTLTRNGELALRDSGLPGETHFFERDPAADFAQPYKESKSRFKVHSPAELLARPPIPWIIKRIIPKKETAMLFGPSGLGKSFVTLDLAIAVARGVPWFGCKTNQCGVLWVAAEGGASLTLRLNAYQQHHGINLDSVPFGAITASVSMRDGDEQDIIEAALERPGTGLIVLDTLNRSMGGGDENSGSDMSQYLAAVGQISEQTGATVLVVHHTGKDLTKGARGHSSLNAAVNTELKLEKVGDQRMLSVSKSRDDEDGKSFAFELLKIKLGVDEDLEDINSCVVLPVEGVTAKAWLKLSNATAVALRSLEYCANAKSDFLIDEPGVAVSEWKSQALKSGISGSEKETAKTKAFDRAKQDLQMHNLISSEGGLYWLTSSGREWLSAQPGHLRQTGTLPSVVSCLSH